MATPVCPKTQKTLLTVRHPCAGLGAAFTEFGFRKVLRSPAFNHNPFYKMPTSPWISPEEFFSGHTFTAILPYKGEKHSDINVHLGPGDREHLMLFESRGSLVMLVTINPLFPGQPPLKGVFAPISAIRYRYNVGYYEGNEEERVGYDFKLASNPGVIHSLLFISSQDAEGEGEYSDYYAFLSFQGTNTRIQMSDYTYEYFVGSIKKSMPEGVMPKMLPLPDWSWPPSAAAPSAAAANYDVNEPLSATNWSARESARAAGTSWSKPAATGGGSAIPTRNDGKAKNSKSAAQAAALSAAFAATLAKKFPNKNKKTRRVKQRKSRKGSRRA